MMNSLELETAIRLNIDLTILLLRGNGLGMIRWKQAGMHFQDFGLELGNYDFVEYAKSYGAFGHRISQPGELGSLLRSCLKTRGVHLIDIPIDYSENESVLTKKLRQKTCLL